jgi:peptide/nickel transport system substrate-binding protein
VAEDPARNLTSTFKADPRVQVLMFKTSGVPQHWPFNMTRWPSNDLAVRQACCYAIDRPRIARVAFFDTATPAKGPLTDNNWAFWPGARQYYPYDPAKAAEVLEAAGYRRNPGTKIYEKDGRPLRLRLVTTSTWDQIGAGTMAQAMMKAVGIDFVVETMTYDATVQRYANNDYELARLGLSYYDPDALRLAFHSSQITAGSQWNRGRLQDKELDAMLDQAGTLHDVNARKRAYAAIQKRLLDMANAMYVWEDAYLFAALSCVKGWSWSVDGNYQFHNVWLDGDCRSIHS